ncbi:MAG: hypothetical protein PHG02_10005 [Oscillospiraceae bacterium]|nr:hypothetical protein [Oscillospiraceae bacterium]
MRHLYQAIAVSVMLVICLIIGYFNGFTMQLVLACLGGILLLAWNIYDYRCYKANHE